MSTVNGLNVDLSWTAPDSNFDPITAYTILIRGADGSFYEDTVTCDGTNDAAVLNNAACSVPFTTLRASPYLLELGDEVIFTVTATNGYGPGIES